MGCSTGYMSRLLVERDCIVTGIEIDPKAAECARRSCRAVYVRDLNASDWAFDLPAGSFDVVLFGDVLEHLIDPVSALLAVKKVLDSDGTLIVSLPNVVHWITRLKLLRGQFDYEPCGTLDHTHLRFFTVQTSQELLRRTGYNISKFHAAIGGRMSGHFRPAWQYLADLMPGLFAFQLLFEARPA
jgi:2-polyprenyl-3-methyl-5-hydroxy-6-metoxy-1,4-benzoquinol methylase